jgi:sugar-specific transcriptional regulator TrmB
MPLSEQTISQFLGELGLSDRETDVYLHLAKSVPLPASRIARDLHLHKAQIYHLLKKLQRKGIVVSTLEKPARFAGVPFEELLDLHIKNREEEVNDLKSHRRANLLTQWHALERGTQRSHLEHYVVFQGA